MPLKLNRRHFMGAAAATTFAAAMRDSLIFAQEPSGTLTVAMTVAAVPNANGAPDQGGEGLRFMGITLYDQLVTWDLSSAEEAAVLHPGLATSWAVDPDNPLHWDFTLRSGVRFHDGHELTAEDVVFSFERTFSEDLPWFDQRAFAAMLPQIPNIASWGSNGPDNFWIETEVVDGGLPYSLTWLGIVHKGAWEAAGSDWNSFDAQAVGTGPWILESNNPTERCVMVRNPDYWDPARVPNCERLVLLPIPDANTRVAALQSGQVNFIEAPAPDAVPMLEAQGFQIVTNSYPHNWMWFLAQTEDSPWTDERLRKAVNLGIDRSGLRALMGGLMLEGAGIVPPGHPWYGNPSFQLTYDPDQARTLVEQAGYGPGNPLRTKVAISTSGSGQMQPLPMNEFIQQNLREIGIEIEFEVFEWQALIDAWRNGAGAPQSRGCTAMNISQGSFDPFRAFARILQSNMIAPNGVNWSKFSDAEMDEMFMAAQRETDAQVQDALLASIHEQVVDRALFLFAAHDLNPRALAPNVEGFVQAQSWFQDLTPISVS